MKKVLLKFEASTSIGAGHAIRTCVLANKLSRMGCDCSFVTSRATYDFIPSLSTYRRIDPEEYREKEIYSDIFIVDDYSCSIVYEQFLRSRTKFIIAIDDLPNRKHDCDILLDQTYGRNSSEYRELVPNNCKVFTGTKYALIRDEFLKLRDKALKKRMETNKIHRVLISMGGGNCRSVTMQALEDLKTVGFTGHIDVVLGFDNDYYNEIEDNVAEVSKRYSLHVDADMPYLTYMADLAIGAAGSSVWERCCLGLPQVLYVTAENQKNIYTNLINSNLSIFDKIQESKAIFNNAAIKRTWDLIDPSGLDRIILDVV